MSIANPNIIFVTGTDTDVGKTIASVALLKGLSTNGYSTAALKPIAAGSVSVGQNNVNLDALHLQQSATLEFAYSEVNPFLFDHAIAPHLAAASEDKRIDVDSCVQQCQAVLQSHADVVIVEGAGGWMVPLNQEQTMADLAIAMGAGIVLVVAIRLGCLNHALLTVASILKSGLVCRGWIANHPLPEQAECASENIQTLKSMIDAPYLGELLHVADLENTEWNGRLDIDLLLNGR